VEEVGEIVRRLKVAVHLVERVFLGERGPHEAGGERINASF